MDRSIIGCDAGPIHCRRAMVWCDGVAFALVFIYPLAMVWMAREALQELNLSANELLRQLSPVAMPTMAMAITVTSVQWCLPTGGFGQHLLRLIASAISGMAVYALAVSLRRRPLAEEIWEVMGWILRRKQTVGISNLEPDQRSH